MIIKGSFQPKQFYNSDSMNLHLNLFQHKVMMQIAEEWVFLLNENCITEEFHIFFPICFFKTTNAH